MEEGPRPFELVPAALDLAVVVSWQGGAIEDRVDTWILSEPAGFS